MCTTRSILLAWDTLASDVTTSDGLALPVTGWMDTASVKRLRVAFEVAGTTDASGVVKVGIQFANVENAPQTPVVLPNSLSQTGNGSCYPDSFSDVASTAAGWRLARLVFFFKSSGGLRTARVCGRAEIEG